VIVSLARDNGMRCPVSFVDANDGHGPALVIGKARAR
jgi:hypothetical protein